METPVVQSSTGKPFSRSNKRKGRGIPSNIDAYKKSCSCTRAKAIVFCRGCGYYCNGRIRLKCETHPRVSFLLDITQCPQCTSSVFLDEYSV